MDINSTLFVDDILHAFVEQDLLPGTGVTANAFWAGLGRILAEFTPRNAELLQRRDDLQARIDAWWRAGRKPLPKSPTPPCGIAASPPRRTM